MLDDLPPLNVLRRLPEAWTMPVLGVLVALVFIGLNAWGRHIGQMVPQGVQVALAVGWLLVFGLSYVALVRDWAGLSPLGTVDDADLSPAERRADAHRHALRETLSRRLAAIVAPYQGGLEAAQVADRKIVRDLAPGAWACGREPDLVPLRDAFAEHRAVRQALEERIVEAFAILARDVPEARPGLAQLHETRADTARRSESAWDQADDQVLGALAGLADAREHDPGCRQALYRRDAALAARARLQDIDDRTRAEGSAQLKREGPRSLVP